MHLCFSYLLTTTHLCFSHLLTTMHLCFSCAIYPSSLRNFSLKDGQCLTLGNTLFGSHCPCSVLTTNPSSLRTLGLHPPPSALTIYPSSLWTLGLRFLPSALHHNVHSTYSQPSRLTFHPSSELNAIKDNYMYSAVHKVACKPTFAFNIIFLEVSACHCYMLYTKMVNKNYWSIWS